MLLTVKQAAEQLAISSKQVRRLIDAGKLPAVRLGKTARSDRIVPTDLERVVEECRYTNEANDGTSTFSTAVNALGDLLDRELQRPMQRRSKRRSAPALKLVE